MIQLVGEDGCSVPDWFKRRLNDIDRALVCYYNPFQQQFCIDRCTKGSDCLSSDHLSCEKTNVMLFPHIGEAVIEKLKSMDSWSNFGVKGQADALAMINGQLTDSLLRARRKHEDEKAAHDAKVREDSRENHLLVARDNRVQLNKALHLIQQHDMGRVH
jgi:hypothetical protein